MDQKISEAGANTVSLSWLTKTASPVLSPSQISSPLTNSAMPVATTVRARRRDSQMASANSAMMMSGNHCRIGDVSEYTNRACASAGAFISTIWRSLSGTVMFPAAVMP